MKGAGYRGFPQAARDGTLGSMLRVWRPLLIAVSGLVLAVLWGRSLRWDALRDALSGAALPFVAASAVLHVGGLGLRVGRWLVLLDSAALPRAVADAVEACATGWWFNLAVPGRVGELARPLRYAARTGAPAAQLLGTVVIERVWDLLCLGALLLTGAVALSTGGSQGLVAAFVAPLVVGVGAWWGPAVLRSAALHLTASRAGPRVVGALRGLASGLDSGRRDVPSMALWTAAIWLVEAASISALLRAVTGRWALPEAAFATAVSTFGFVLPAGPVSMGLDTVVVAGALLPFGIPAEEGVAISLLSSFTTATGVVPLGLWAFARVAVRPPPPAPPLPPGV